MIKGIDISYWQSSIPSFEGDFIIIRAGYGTTTDIKFSEHYRNAIKLGKKVGVYWYSYALTTDDARKEARTCLEVISGKDISMGVWFDMEDADGYKAKNGFKFTKDNISAICNAFCEITEKAGYYSGIYANYNYFTNYINSPKYDKWIAYWGTNNGNIPLGMEMKLRRLGASIWQYTSKLGGKSQDGDVLLHNDISQYNVQPNKSGTAKNYEDLKRKLKTEVDNIIDKVISDYFK